MPEALEKWPVKVLGKLLPRHLEIIDKIDTIWKDSLKVRSAPEIFVRNCKFDHFLKHQSQILAHPFLLFDLVEIRADTFWQCFVIPCCSHRPRVLNIAAAHVWCSLQIQLKE